MKKKAEGLQRKNLGFGLGLRSSFQHVILNGASNCDWFEALTENYLGLEGHGQGYSLKALEKIREDYPIVLHGVSMSIGSTSPLNYNYINQLRKLIQYIQPEWVSDHLCFTGSIDINSHDLLPLPYTEKTIEHICQRILEVQDHLKQVMVFENVSSYLEYNISEMTEYEFITSITNQTGCKILLDVNNVYVSSQNHGYKPLDFIEALPIDSIWQVHLAGHRSKNEILIDTHDSPVIDKVWDLYCEVIQRTGPLSTLLEWDENIPEYEQLESELFKARETLKQKEIPWT